ncbi:hypothetical protein [Mesorhizobium sp. C395A]|uniref:hypothetical protein n=1 Tax=Mesorhizobium sp. C395A TaxID=2956832 RepID=UPI001FDAA332|nr:MULTISPECIES: hypothetical protein [unclassified Mesorhizobium]WJI76717.1 hypothetical protein NLY37_08450 [Mesorhizobium sp. C395A]
MIARTDCKQIPPRVDYALTPIGESLSCPCGYGERRRGRDEGVLRQPSDVFVRPG